MAEISINPSLTTNAAGSFNVQSLGFIQGLALDDPAVRNELAGGYLDAAQTVPMWGGVAIEELIAAVTESRGPSIKRASGAGVNHCPSWWRAVIAKSRPTRGRRRRR